MKFTCIALLGFLLLAGTGKAGDDKTPDKKKLLGVWEVLKSDDYPLLSSAEFKKKRLIRTFFKNGATTKQVFDYELDGKKLTTTIDTGGKVSLKTVTIDTLTDKSLILIDENGKKEEFRRRRR